MHLLAFHVLTSNKHHAQIEVASIHKEAWFIEKLAGVLAEIP